MLKRNHREFPSDLFTIFETVGAQISIGKYICIIFTYPHETAWS